MYLEYRRGRYLSRGHDEIFSAENIDRAHTSPPPNIQPLQAGLSTVTSDISYT